VKPTLGRVGPVVVPGGMGLADGMATRMGRCGMGDDGKGVEWLSGVSVCALGRPIDCSWAKRLLSKAVHSRLR
jgi:hypothetical protein